jgi:hypothetical protein
LQLRKGPLEILATGDPAGASPALQPLASIIADLESFDHPSLRPYAPTEYWLTARLGSLPGGCRSWPSPEPLTEGSRTVPASHYSTWPTGARPASVCRGKAFVVTLRRSCRGANGSGDPPDQGRPGHFLLDGDFRAIVAAENDAHPRTGLL